MSATMPDLVAFNVGGKEFVYDRSSVISSGENLLNLAISGVWKEQKSYFINADPEMFRKWIDPFIRYSILPDMSTLKDAQEVNILLATVDYLGIQVLMNRLLKPPTPEGAFGKEKWEKYFGDVGEPPPVPSDFVEALERACPFFPGKVSETSVYGLMPKEVDGKPWGLNAADEWLQKITEGRVKLDWSLVKQEYGNAPVEKPYWFLMTKDVMEGSRGKTREQQLAMANIEGYEAPKLLEAVTAILMYYVSSGDKKTRLLGDDPWTLTCCQELVDGYKGVVGGFSGSGLSVYAHYSDDADDVGVAPLRKFLGT